MSTTEISSISIKGNVQGSILMIAGCCIGAGMLGLPAITLFSGFLPSCMVLFFSWMFMVATGLLLLEVNLRFKTGTNLFAMTEYFFGKKGKYFCTIVFFFLFYSLIIAYLSGTGILIAEFINNLFALNVSENIGITICCLIIGYAIFKGTRLVDLFNRLSIVIMVAAYLFLIILGTSKIELQNLLLKNFGKEMIFSIPIIFVAFGYQNLIPSLTTYLNRNVKKIRLAILIGTSIPFIIYIVWEMLIMGMISKEQISLFTKSSESTFIIHLLTNSIRLSYVLMFIKIFSFFAFLTSLLTVGLSCFDFLADFIKIRKHSLNRLIITLVVLIPPFYFSLNNPNIFLKSLSLAGGLGAVLIFGALPVLMAWKHRHKDNMKEDIMLPGGKFSLVLLMMVSLTIFTIEIIKQFKLI